MSSKTKSPKKLERHFKGVANHKRIQILLHIADHKGVIQEDIIEVLKGNQKMVSEHIRRLYAAGLIDKDYEGRSIVHTLTPYGEVFVRFIRDFAKISADA